MTSAPAPVGAGRHAEAHAAQRALKWPQAVSDLRDVLASIDPNLFRRGPKWRREWRGMLTILAWELGRRGVRAPPLLEVS